MLGCAAERIAVTRVHADPARAAWTAAGCGAELACSAPGAGIGAPIDCVKGAKPEWSPGPPGAGGSMAVRVRFPGTVEVLRRDALGGDDRIDVAAVVPGDAPPLECTLLLWTRDGLWWQSEPRPLPAAGGAGATLVRFDLLHDLVPVNHSAPFQRYLMRDVDHVGVRLRAMRSWEGTIRVQASGAGHAGQRPLAIERVRLPPSPVAVHGLAEVGVELSREFLNPFDPLEVDVSATITTPRGRTMVQPCYFDQERRASGAAAAGPGRGTFGLRFSPGEPGRYTFRITARAGAERAESPVHGIIAGGRAPGALPPIRIGADGRSFATDAGEAFYPVGHNIHSPRALIDPDGPAFAGGGLAVYEEAFDRMAAAGENLAEVWMSPWWLGLEWSRSWPGYHGLGWYHLEHAWLLDRVLDAAARRGIYVHLVVDNHGMYSSFCDEQWSSSPYSASNGGFLASPDEFFTDPRAFAVYRNRLRYILARWGARSNVMGLVLLNEIDLTGSRKGSHRRPEVLDWLRRAARFVRETDVHGHLLTVHFSGDHQRVEPSIAADASVDYVAVDAYRDGPFPFPELALRSAAALAPYGKPFLFTEYGSSPRSGNPLRGKRAGAERELEADLRAGLWASWLTPAAGAPLFWWFDLIHRNDLYRHYSAFRAFTAGESRLAAAGYRTSLHRAAEGVEIMLYGDASAGWGWAYDRAGMTAGAEPAPAGRSRPVAVSLRARPGGRYRIEYWDTFSGRPAGDAVEAAGDDGVLVAVLPAFRSDIAFKWRAVGVVARR